MAYQAALARKYGGNAPRYTSYPTAPHFTDKVDAAVYGQWLQTARAVDAASLYLHVPYCHQLCWYCGCNTRATQSYGPVAHYAETLLREIALVRNAFNETPRVDHVHWGGGTPTFMNGDDFLAIMSELRKSFNFSDDAEIAIEIDPRTLTDAKIEALADAGVTRASLGVQVFAENVQRAINRVQPYTLVVRAVDRLRAAGIKALSFDIMYGLPLQSLADVEQTAAACAELRPDRVSVFGYAHVPWMKSHQRLISDDDLPDAEARYAQADAAARVLVDAGYVAIGLDHFALPEDSLTAHARSGALRRNFQGYTDDLANFLIGFGASAIGSLPQGYVQNISSVSEYEKSVRAGALPTARGVELDDDDRLRRAIIERLMCDYRVDLKSICDQFGAANHGFTSELDMLEPFVEDGVVFLEGETISIPAEQRPYVRSVCAVFDRYLMANKARHSRVI